MSKNSKIGMIIWGLSLALALVLLFTLQNGMTATFWITFGFVCLAFISSLIFQMKIWKISNSPDEQFIHWPPIIFSSVYMIAQIPIILIFGIGSSAISYKVTIIINAILLVLAWVAVLSSMAGNDHIRNVDSRQKDHHTEL
ncbi:MAG: hypothetical protein PUB39_07225 [Eubacteriales bacterium]|nr:hypothetical protein [Eubacteriales bacterium]